MEWWRLQSTLGKWFGCFNRQVCFLATYQKHVYIIVLIKITAFLPTRTCQALQWLLFQVIRSFKALFDIKLWMDSWIFTSWLHISLNAKCSYLPPHPIDCYPINFETMRLERFTHRNRSLRSATSKSLMAECSHSTIWRWTRVTLSMGHGYVKDPYWISLAQILHATFPVTYQMNVWLRKNRE